MKLGQVAKLDKRSNLKKTDNGVMLENCDIIVIFPIHGQSMAGCIVCKTYIFIQSNFLSYKN